MGWIDAILLHRTVCVLIGYIALLPAGCHIARPLLPVSVETRACLLQLHAMAEFTVDHISVSTPQKLFPSKLARVYIVNSHSSSLLAAQLKELYGSSVELLEGDFAAPEVRRRLVDTGDVGVNTSRVKLGTYPTCCRLACCHATIAAS